MEDVESLKTWIKNELKKGLDAAIERNLCPKDGGALFDGYIQQNGTIEGDPWCCLCGYKPKEATNGT